MDDMGIILPDKVSNTCIFIHIFCSKIKEKNDWKLYLNLKLHNLNFYSVKFVCLIVY